MPKRACPSDATSSQPKKSKSTVANTSQPLTTVAVAATKRTKKAAGKRDLSLDIPSHEKGLRKKYQKLKKAVRENWHDGYEEHAGIIGDIVGSINDWQGEVFRAAIAKGEQLDAACEALKVMDTWINKMKGNEANTRTVWDDMDDFSENSVEDVRGNRVFTGVPDNIQIKLWRDTALKAIIKKDQATIDTIVELFKEDSDMARGSFKFEVDENTIKMRKESLDSLRKLVPTELMEYRGWRDDDFDYCVPVNENEDGYPVEDEWYADDEEMKKALEVFKKLVGA